MPISIYLNKIIGLVLLIMLMANCSTTKKARENELQKLQQEEESLMEQIKVIAYPAKWQILEKKVLKVAKDYPDVASEQLYLAQKLQAKLNQASQEAKAGNVEAQEKLLRCIHQVREGGFKAKNADQASRRLEMWIKLLQNIHQQQKLTKDKR